MAKINKPESLEDYFSWSVDTLDSDFESKRIENLYNINIKAVETAAQEHGFFSNFPNASLGWGKEYNNLNNCELYTGEYSPDLCTKPFSSAIDKSFRQNVLWNINFPEAPKSGWITKENISYKFNDLVRGYLVCRFVDGPGFLAEKLGQYAKSHGLESRSYSQERDDGYYAYHFYVKIPVKIVDESLNDFIVDIEVEIQVTTQLQDVLRSITHKFYENERTSINNDSGKWKWNFESGKFKAGYLSHTLHLLESIILESRNSTLKREDENA